MNDQEWKDRYADLAKTFSLQRDKIVELQGELKNERLKVQGLRKTLNAIAIISGKNDQDVGLTVFRAAYAALADTEEKL